MDFKVKLKDKFTKTYLLPQDKKWMRIIDAIAPVLCFISSAIAIYLIKTQSEQNAHLTYTLNMAAYGYLVTSLPLAYLLYKKSELIKIQRFVLVLFILFSSMSLLLAVIPVLKNNNALNLINKSAVSFHCTLLSQSS